MNSKHKELLLQNENVLKCFVYNQLVSKQSNNATAEEEQKKNPRKAPTRHETKDHVSKV